jgi:hypothetical protein
LIWPDDGTATAHDSVAPRKIEIVKGNNKAETRKKLKKLHLSTLFGVSAATIFVVALCMKGQAQQTVFNVPTTDVLDKGKAYFELDASFKTKDSTAVNRFSSFVPRLVVGAGHRIETGVNILGNIQPGPDSTIISPTIKWKVYDGKDNGWALVLGDNLFIPVHNRVYDAGTYSYVMTQKTFNKSTRVGFGGYFFSKDVVAPNAMRTGGQFTFEQPLNKKVTIAADWFTGRHSAGYFTPGVVFKVGAKITGYASYPIGNQNASRGNHFFLVEFGYNFN